MTSSNAVGCLGMLGCALVVLYLASPKLAAIGLALIILAWLDEVLL